MNASVLSNTQQVVLYAHNRVKVRVPKPTIVPAGRWSFSLGVELTYTAQHLDDCAVAQLVTYRNVCGITDAVVGGIQSVYARPHILEGSKHKMPKMYDVGYDPGVVEIPTLPLYTWREFASQADYWAKLLKQFKFGHRSQLCAGGGAHIHVGLQDHHKDLWEWCMFDMYGRPYITRAFAGSNDMENAQPLKVPLTPEDIIEEGIIEEGIRTNTDSIIALTSFLHTPEVWGDQTSRGNVLARMRIHVLDRVKLRGILAARNRPNATAAELFNETSRCGSKASALRVTSYGDAGTLEFRMFQMPETLREHEEHIAFTLAYMEYVEGKRERGVKVVAQRPTSVHEDMRAFDDFIVELGLPVERYRKYKVNIALRYRYFRSIGCHECY